MLKFRRAKEGDIDTLLEWRNDPLAREASRYTGVVSKENFKRDVFDAREVWIAEDAIGNLVGTMNIVHRDKESELSWAIAPQHRGKGVGTILVREAVQMLLPVLTHPLVAEIREGNVASEKIAAAAGFSKQTNENIPGFTQWEFVPNN